MKMPYITAIILASTFILGCNLPGIDLPKGFVNPKDLANIPKTSTANKPDTLTIKGVDDNGKLASKYFDDPTKTPVVKWEPSDLPRETAKVYTVMRNTDTGEIIWYARSEPSDGDSSNAKSNGDGFNTGKDFSPPKRSENTDDEYEIITIATNDEFDPNTLNNPNTQNNDPDTQNNDPDTQNDNANTQDNNPNTQGNSPNTQDNNPDTQDNNPDNKDIASIPGVLTHDTRTVTVPSTSSSPLIVTKIASEENLKTIKHCLDCSYTLEEDINVEDWETINPRWNNPPFQGTLDGKGKTIKNLNKQMFGKIGGAAKIKDINIEIAPELTDSATLARTNDGTIDNVKVTGVLKRPDRSPTYFGGLVFTNGDNGKITNSRTELDIEILSSDAAGGIAVRNYGTIEKSTATGSIKGGIGTIHIGGIAGENLRGSIIDSTASGDIEGFDGVGGLVGWNIQGKIEGSTASGNVKGVRRLDNGKEVGGSEIGGLVGDNDGPISDSKATGNVEGRENTGGLVGRNKDGGEISDSHASGTVNGAGPATGGLVGKNEGGTIKKSYASGAITSIHSQVGGLIGMNEGPIEYSYASGKIEGSGNHVGGLVGENKGEKASILTSYASGNTEGYGDNVGGLVGTNNNANIQNSYASGNTKGHGNNVGGLIGKNNADIQNIYASGTVEGQNFVGGLIGSNDASIEKSYAAGSVSGNREVGGLIGKLESAVINITLSYFDNTKATRDIGSDHEENSSITAFTTKNDKIENAYGSSITQFDFVRWDFDSIWEWEDFGQWPSIKKDAIKQN